MADVYAEERRIFTDSNQLTSCTFPWLPIPEEMTTEHQFSIYMEESTMECRLLKGTASVQLDACGFYFYWYIDDPKVVFIIDMATVEDVEYYEKASVCSSHPSLNFTNSCSLHTTKLPQY
ncbi:unnamed protein product [Dicrocoelium dendriticum]|nr:unnamed protein product [Dicrocoelium dendriticum]